MSQDAHKELMKVFRKAEQECKYCSESMSPEMTRWCGVEEDGYKCTRQDGHSGNHVACGSLHHPIKEWR